MEVEIAWGDCDDAGIVFYPHFFRWMDTACHRWLRALGMSHRDVVHRFGVIGLPLVDVGAQFRSPVSYDDTLIIAVRVAEWQPRRFRLAYRGTRPDATLVFEGHEIRAFVARDAGSGRLKGIDIAPEFKALLGG
jgi:4-hydroxybenzoyl-CoA thioesterase